MASFLTLEQILHSLQRACLLFISSGSLVLVSMKPKFIGVKSGCSQAATEISQPDSDTGTLSYVYCNVVSLLPFLRTLWIGADTGMRSESSEWIFYLHKIRGKTKSGWAVLWLSQRNNDQKHSEHPENTKAFNYRKEYYKGWMTGLIINFWRRKHNLP